MIGFSSVNSRPIMASVRRLRNGLLALWLDALLAKCRHAGTAAIANTANINSCVCHDGLIANDTRPTISEDSPSQNRNTPGASNSSAIRMNPKISQFQVPRVTNISAMTRPLVLNVILAGQRKSVAPRHALSLHRRRGAGAWHRTTARGGGSGRRTFAEGRLGDFADAGERAQNAHGFDRQHDDLLVRRISQLPESLDVFVGDELVQRGDVTLGDR